MKNASVNSLLVWSFLTEFFSPKVTFWRFFRDHDVELRLQIVRFQLVSKYNRRRSVPIREKKAKT